MIDQTELTDREFIDRLNAALKISRSLRQAARRIGENYDSVYTRIGRLGYKVNYELRLVPIHAPALDSKSTEAAV